LIRVNTLTNPANSSNPAENFGFLVGWFLMLALGWKGLMYGLGRTFSGKREKPKP
jgi:hypothetical protein